MGGAKLWPRKCSTAIVLLGGPNLQPPNPQHDRQPDGREDEQEHTDFGEENTHGRQPIDRFGPNVLKPVLGLLRLPEDFSLLERRLNRR